MKDSLEKSVRDSVLTNELENISKDILELTLDSFLDDGVLKDLPIFSFVYSFTKTTISIKERIFAKKILQFLFELKDTPQVKRQEFIEKIEKNEKSEAKFGETILMILDKADNLQKARLAGKLLAECIKGNISYEEFLKLTSILNRSYVPTLQKLADLKNNLLIQENEYEELFNLGLVTLKLEDVKDNLSWIEKGVRERFIESRSKPAKVYNQRIAYAISQNGDLMLRTLFSNENS